MLAGGCGGARFGCGGMASSLSCGAGVLAGTVSGRSGGGGFFAAGGVGATVVVCVPVLMATGVCVGVHGRERQASGGALKVLGGAVDVGGIGVLGAAWLAAIALGGLLRLSLPRSVMVASCVKRERA